MSIRSTLKKAFDKSTALVLMIRKKNILNWAAYYFIGVWAVLEPSITLFGVSDNDIGLMRDLGFALFPLVLIAAWFRGEKGKQGYSPQEGKALVVGAVCSVLIFVTLSRSPAPEYTIVASLRDAQADWYEQKILKEFEKQHGMKINLVSFSEHYAERLQHQLESENDSTKLLLVNVPLSHTGILLNQDETLIRPYDDIATQNPDLKNRFRRHLARLDPNAVRFGKRHLGDGKLYFLPERYQTMVAVYKKDLVEEAAANWQTRRANLNTTLTELTGNPLPTNYALESDPNLWDWYDVFVSSWYWARKSHAREPSPASASPYAGNKDLFFYLMNRALSQGARLDEVFNFPYQKQAVSANAVAEVYLWEVLFRRADVYYPGMWFGKGLTQNEIVEALKSEELFLAFLDNERLGELSEHNLQVASFPAGASLDGKRRNQSGFSNIWFWAIPSGCPEPELALKLAIWLTEHQHQKQMALEWFFLPTHLDLLGADALEAGSNGHLWDRLQQQIKINESGYREINPYKDFESTDYEILLRFYRLKWQELITGEGYFSMPDKLMLEYIVGALLI